MNLKVKLNAAFANFRDYLPKESAIAKQDLNTLVISIPRLIKYGAFLRLHRHQSSVSWRNYC